MSADNTRLPTWFVSHGGGPWPWLAEMGPMMAGLAQSLRELPATLPHGPQAVLMISAHWESPSFTVMSHPHPPMLYDYYGFPPHTYDVVYPASGSPLLAEKVQAMIATAGLPAELDAERGFDHGLSFHNLCRLGPEARVPSKLFDNWLQQTLVGSTPPEREARLLRWSAAPAARDAHPREEHLLPLMVAVSAASEDVGDCPYREEDVFGGVVVSSFRFGAT